jgi:hypothetical protein
MAASFFSFQPNREIVKIYIEEEDGKIPMNLYMIPYIFSPQ